jgi:hypothetical protein
VRKDTRHLEPPPAPPTAPETSQPKTSILVWFAAHPIVGFVGTVASVLGVVLAVVLYLAAIRTRELSLYVNPSKTTLVKSGQSSDLHVLYRGNDVSTDVTALQVELWNAGKESIRPAHVLSPIVLETTPRVPILEARIRHTSRSVTEIVLDQTHIADGKVTVSWKILEHNDGAVIQFILAAPTETSIRASGALEGQGRVNVFDLSNQGFPWTFFGIFVVIGTAVMLLSIRLVRYVPFPKDQQLRYLTIQMILAAELFIAFALLSQFFRGPSMPIRFD